MNEIKLRCAAHEIFEAENQIRGLDNQQDSAIPAALKRLKTARELMGLHLPTLKVLKELFTAAGWEMVDSVTDIVFFAHCHGKKFSATVYPEDHKFYDCSRNAAMLELEAWRTFKKELGES